jgi:hypothetical protein
VARESWCAVDNTLQTELAFFESNRAHWLLKHSGAFVAVRGRHVIGFFPDWHTAFLAGCARVDIRKSFLVKQVLEHDPVYYIFAVASQEQEYLNTTYGLLAGGNRSGV